MQWFVKECILDNKNCVVHNLVNITRIKHARKNKSPLNFEYLLTYQNYKVTLSRVYVLLIQKSFIMCFTVQLMQINDYIDEKLLWYTKIYQW